MGADSCVGAGDEVDRLGQPELAVLLSGVEVREPYAAELREGVNLALMPSLGEKRRAAKTKLTPMKCLGEVVDSATMASCLAIPALNWLTGKVFEVDCGTESRYSLF